MSKHMIELPHDLYVRLQKHAVAFVDTPISVIERALVALEAGEEAPAEPGRPDAPRSFNPAAAPDLSHTTPHRILVGDVLLGKGEVYWNPLMYAVIGEAAARGVGKEDLMELITVNRVEGRKDDQGYRYLPDVGISVQGQGANAAWKQAYRIASSVGIRLDVVFAWQSHPKAAMPNTLGSLFVEGE